jgi:putative membrane protein
MKVVSLIGIACLGFGSLWLTGCDKDDDDEAEPNNLSQADRTFMTKASYSNRAEIEFGQTAQDRGSHAAVKDFGQHMVNDHSLALNELDSLADRWNVDLPNGLDSLHTAKKQQLSSMSGHQFDTAYLNSQLKDHIEAIALFQNEAANGQEQRLKDYANKYLPHLQMHKAKVDSTLAVVK